MRSKPRGSLAERFWAKVDRGSPDACWTWTAARNHSGYGRMSLGGRQDGWAQAHRVSWELHYGDIPDGMYVCHRCDNPPCVNPAHLFVGTPADNTADMVSKGRSTAGKPGHAARLTVAEVLALRAAHIAGVSQKQLARNYGIKYQSVQKIVKRRSYAWVGE